MSSTAQSSHRRSSSVNNAGLSISASSGVDLSPQRAHRIERGDAGQATAEYALVLLGVAAIALLVLAWTARTSRIGQLLDAVFDSIVDKVV